jgi:RecB family exonuclease
MNSQPGILAGLNREQLQAVTHLHGPLKIVAGAGTGKTGTLTRRFAYLVEQGVNPDRILALTFSRRAASEYRERVLTLLDESYPRLWIGTFHGFCLRVLRAERDCFERRRVEGLLSRCLTPALRPPDAYRRPVVDVPTTLSYSMLATYQDCSRKAYLRFLAGFPGEPRPGATAAGTAFHAAVETIAAAELAGRESSFEDFLASYRESAAEAHGVTLYTVSEPERTMLQSFWEGPDRLATPLFVEAEFYWRVGPGYLHGFIDRIQRYPDGTIELIDFKTSRQAMSESDARESLQLLIYALAVREVYGVTPDRLSLVYPRLNQRVSVSFSDEELRIARMTIVNLMERARTASYDDVDTRHCPMCEYRLICPAASLFR